MDTSNTNNNSNSDLENSIQLLNTQISELKESNLRLLADCDNIRKFYEAKLLDAKELSNKIMINKILDVYDDLLRAFEHISSNLDKKSLEGFEQIFIKYKNLLDSLDIEEVIINKGDEFNPEFMEALSKVKIEELEPNKVAFIVQKAYRFKSGSLLNTAKVFISE